MRSRILFLLLFLVIPSLSWADIHTADCSQASIDSAYAAASAGDIVDVGSGTCAISLTIGKAITFRGGQSGTTNLGASSISVLTDNVRVTGFTFTGGSIEFSGSTTGLVDHVTLTAPADTSIEFIKVYGPDNAWASDATYGTATNIFIEDCNFTAGGGSAQCAQGNYNARVVFRYNTIAGCKFDMHGIWSNGDPANYCNWTAYTDVGYQSDAHSARHAEVYENTWTSGATNGCMELRGGTGYFYNNTMTVNDWADGITIRDYCASYAGDGNCCGTLCPSTYPWRDQPGLGKNQVLDPMYFWNNLTGVAGDVQVVGFTQSPPHSDPSHIIHFEGILSAARVTACGAQVPGWTDGGVTLCDMTAVVQENRDYYVSTTKPAALSGYTAYTYPHPFQGGGDTTPPTAVGVTIKGGTIR